jgi:hypothetical protein
MVMRRPLLSFLVSLLVVTLMPAPAVADAGLEQRAYALVVLPERSSVFPAFFVDVRISEDGVRTFGIYRGSCFGRATSENCFVSSSGLSGELRPADVFEFDPALGSARLEVTRKGVTHEVVWEAVASGAPVVRPYDCLSPMGPAVGTARFATANATIFGKKASSPDPDEAALEVVAYTC